MVKYISIFIKYYLPAIFFAGVIFFLSSVPSLQVGVQSTAEAIILRKGAHFVEYSILAILIWRIFYLGHKFCSRYAFFWALIIASLYGASDEFHQLFVFGRTGKIIDAFYDAASVLFTLEICVMIVRKKITWKNIAVLFLATALLIGLEFKMISETKSFSVSFSKIKKSFGYMVEHELEYFKSNEKNLIEINKENQPELKVEEALGVNDVAPEVVSEQVEVPFEVPENISIKVPFTSQAPLGKWDEIHEEACEEASLVMVKYYLDEKKITPQIAEKEIQSLVTFQKKTYGDYKDTDAQETVKLAKDFYDMKNLSVVYDFSVDDLKTQLARGKPIIIPAAGRLLKNPFFTPPGPLYHNLVLTGYDGDKIITNDPGTRRGEGYTYDIDILYNAIHDFSGKVEEIEKGRKAMIVME